MSRQKTITIAIVFAVVFSCGWAVAEEAPQQLKNMAMGEFARLGTDPVIVAVVKAENAKGKTLDKIKAKDQEWTATPGIADYMKALMDSPCGKHLREIQQSAPYYAEIFVMDNQGANVAMTDKTSDYWQGDEAKFQKSFNGGSGAVFVDEVEFDDSSQAYLCQVSVPVMDGTRAIGAITIGVDMDQLQ
ncbi:cache domain-containing protein [Desulfosarcina ovata]|uniref:Cache domain-containing protein n=2 Tax=Desulfosarcina ovata TaxID=83564 RepID=A0A5K8AG32_9BACT|nr:cache domain-containing protein [Desulfosarcina ovata]BBO83267.1 hypothetical protein DSCO28_38330 [Desulfosarcina ovata subsp. sediminis]BBO91597.1 hypothetical protein DSCOOX_47770 [Desulfosarcina ovata subsp. ovata]